MNHAYLQKAAKVFIMICLFLNILLLAGCWDRVEINDLALVLAAGIDRAKDGRIELSVQLAMPKALGGGGKENNRSSSKSTIVVEATGITIFDAMSRLQAKLSRRISWGLNQAIVFGKRIAEEGIRNHIDFITRHPSPRMNAYVFVSKGKPVDILKVIPNLEQSSTDIMVELTKFEAGISATVLDLIQMLDSDAGAAALSWIDVEQEAENKLGIKLNGTAVFKGDKMVGQVYDKIFRGVIWFKRELQSIAVTIQPKNADGLISFNLYRSRTALLPKIQDGRWKIAVKNFMEFEAVENETTLDLMDIDTTTELEKQLEQKIDRQILTTLTKVQKEMGADILDFAEAFHSKFPKEWAKAKAQWHEIFPNVNIEVVSKAYIRRPGLSTAPPTD